MCFQNTFLSFLTLSSPSPLSPFAKCRHNSRSLKSSLQLLLNHHEMLCWDTIHICGRSEENICALPMPGPQERLWDSSVVLSRGWGLWTIRLTSGVEIKDRGFCAILCPRSHLPRLSHCVQLNRTHPVVKWPCELSPHFSCTEYMQSSSLQCMYYHHSSSYWIGCSAQNPLWGLPWETYILPLKMSNRD